MIYWNDVFYFSIISASLLLSVLGVGFSAIFPGIDRWSRRFFLIYFLVFILCCISGFADIMLSYLSGPSAVYYCEMVLECLTLSLPLPMLTVYLLHCCGESIRRNRFFYNVLALWTGYFALLTSSLFTDGFTYVTPDNRYARGPLYPVLLLPLIAILLFNLIGTMKRRERLSRKVFFSFLIAILPMMVALTVHLFVNVFPLIDISYVLSVLAMFGLILSDQIEQELHHQQEIASQRNSILVLKMRPHFIYNTLMSIYCLCNQNPQKARQVTLDFTNYLRKNFNAVASETPIPFSAELEHTRNYLAVEQALYEDLLLVEYDTQFLNFRLPPLTLQPIAENAVKHGMDPYGGPLHVTVRTYRADHASVVVVEDNGPGFDTAMIDESHTTLANIRQRLEWMCRGKMEIASQDGGGTKVTMTIPDRKEEERSGVQTFCIKARMD